MKELLDESPKAVLPHTISGLVSRWEHADQLHNFGLIFGEQEYENAMKYWLECGKYLLDGWIMFTL